MNDLSSDVKFAVDWREYRARLCIREDNKLVYIVLMSNYFNYEKSEEAFR